MIYNWNIALVEDFFYIKIMVPLELHPYGIGATGGDIFFWPLWGALIPVGPIPTSYGVLTLLGSCNHYLT